MITLCDLSEILMRMNEITRRLLYVHGWLNNLFFFTQYIYLEIDKSKIEFAN